MKKIPDTRLKNPNQNTKVLELPLQSEKLYIMSHQSVISK